MEKLYKIRTFLKNNLSKNRYEHSLRVESTSISLAEKYNLPVQSCAMAGLAHDICRELNSEQLMTRTGRAHDNPVLLHGEAGSIFLSNHFGIKDISILDAVRFHTSGKAHMDGIGKVVFAADYLEPGRTHLNQRERDRLFLLSLDDMVLEIAIQTKEHLIMKNYIIEPELDQLIKGLLKDTHSG